ncbi:MAG: FHA domain-containing protein [Dehalococcoidia bacterium]|nr:FHA domain-containing protein [Dehalococcoidia bacterium]
MPTVRFLGPHGESSIAFQDTITIGRDAKCTVAFPNDKDCSRQHARITSNGDGWVVEDLGSRNGAYLERGRVTRRITAPTPLEDGDVIHLTPRTKLTFIADVAAPEPLTKPAVTGDTWFGRVTPTFLTTDAGEWHTVLHTSPTSPLAREATPTAAAPETDLAARVRALEERVAALEALARQLSGR